MLSANYETLQIYSCERILFTDIEYYILLFMNLFDLLEGWESSGHISNSFRFKFQLQFRLTEFLLFPEISDRGI